MCLTGVWNSKKDRLRESECRVLGFCGLRLSVHGLQGDNGLKMNNLNTEGFAKPLREVSVRMYLPWSKRREEKFSDERWKISLHRESFTYKSSNAFCESFCVHLFILRWFLPHIGPAWLTKFAVSFGEWKSLMREHELTAWVLSLSTEASTSQICFPSESKHSVVHSYKC